MGNNEGYSNLNNSNAVVRAQSCQCSWDKILSILLFFAFYIASISLAIMVIHEKAHQDGMIAALIFTIIFWLVTGVCIRTHYYPIENSVNSIFSWLNLRILLLFVLFEGTIVSMVMVIIQGAQQTGTVVVFVMSFGSGAGVAVYVFLKDIPKISPEVYLRSSSSDGGQAQSDREGEWKGQGLPNLGLTCYLNSVLQLLFAVKEYRQELISWANKPPRKKVKFIRSLGRLFQEMKKTNQKQIRLALENLSDEIRERDEQKKFLNNSEQDALQACLFILGETFSENHNLYNLFTVQYQTKCQCECDRLAFRELYLAYGTQTCVKCKKPLQQTLMLSPKYLLLLCNGHQGFETSLQYKGVSSNVKYNLLSRAIYFGNGKSGHYIAERKTDKGQTVLCNDKQVYKGFSGGKTLFAIFSKEEVENKSEIKQLAM